MSKFFEYLLSEKEKSEAYLIESTNRTTNKTKDDYIVNAEEGLIVAFRLNFEAKSGIKLTKVISGKIIENNKEHETYVVETRNGLKYGVPYVSVVWVKTGDRWPRGVYEEMKLGSVAVKEEELQDDIELSELEEYRDIDPDPSDIVENTTRELEED